ncbi:YceI family protein [Bacillus sp. REN16]|uniref:YceI family protein n=1 Tax=Bacillus sp. REN16 TaxID=2887296 RepID=UPI001E5F562F|nr:EAL domain-containing protein [Bacillus sp. REN16]MCC3358155.1 EAL domain-containing protein [Bacillus sp. REN16]
MGKWIVDKGHSTVGFEVKHMMVSKVRGQFDSFTAEVEAEDLTDLTNAQIIFKFDGDSINTRNQERDTISILKEIQKLGIQISVDDFGTGYSSLSYIKELPINTLKIDQSFVNDIHTNKESKEIAKAIINLANSIGLNVIAEGIELKEHVDELSKGGLILGQGYYYSRPLKVGAFEDYMTNVHEAS